METEIFPSIKTPAKIDANHNHSHGLVDSLKGQLQVVFCVPTKAEVNGN